MLIYATMTTASMMFMTAPMTMTRKRCQRVLGHEIVRRERPAGLEHPLAQELDVSADGNEADPVIRLPLLEAR